MRAKGGTRCLSLCHSAHANGRVGSKVSDADGTSSILGLVGGPFAHGAREAPRSGQSIVVQLKAAEPLGCFRDLRAAGTMLDRHGFVGLPQWAALQESVRPLPATDFEPSEWAHGWQHYASSASEYHFRKVIVLRQSCPANQAHLRSHSGAGSSQVLLGCPTKLEFRIAPDLFRTVILERLRLPLFVFEVRCECGYLVDGQGRHRTTCFHSGRLRTRASAPERTLARVCREAGASVRFNAKLLNMNIAVPANDARAVEVLASGLPLVHGAQLAVDITLQSVLTATGMLRPGAAVVDGIVCMAATSDMELKYSELLCGDRCRLVVVALETCGRWTPDAVDFIERLAMSRARDAPPNLQRSAFLSWRRRWTRMIAISCSRSFANSLVAQSSHPHVLAGVDGEVLHFRKSERLW